MGLLHLLPNVCLSAVEMDKMCFILPQQLIWKRPIISPSTKKYEQQYVCMYLCLKSLWLYITSGIRN